MSDILGGIGLTHLRVYCQRPGPDGVRAGCAHVHAVTDEGYYVIGGEGAIELHDQKRGFRRVPLARGDYVQFGPGTLHRSVSTDRLEVLVLIGNAGLAERGDARIYFGPEVDDDPECFERLVALSQRGLEGALERRDASARGYTRLLRLWQADRRAYEQELARFVDLHRRAIGPQHAAFRAVVDAGPARWLELVGRRIAGEPDPAAAIAIRHDSIAERFGMCGVLRPLGGLGPI